MSHLIVRGSLSVGDPATMPYRDLGLLSIFNYFWISRAILVNWYTGTLVPEPACPNDEVMLFTIIM